MSVVIDLEARANLRRNLKRTLVGLNIGMTAREIREHDINQCEARIRAEARRRIALTNNTASTAIFLRTLAADLENE